MEPFKLRIKIGDHEFEAEGDQESVERQFATWRDLVATQPLPPAAPAGSGTLPSGTPVPPSGSGNGDFTEYDKVFRYDGRVVSLSVLPRGENARADAALLIMLGRKHYADEDLVGGAWLIDGMEQSGIPSPRLDRIMAGYLDSLVTTVGRNRALRWRLTNLGDRRAKEVARELVAMVA